MVLLEPAYKPEYDASVGISFELRKSYILRLSYVSKLTALRNNCLGVLGGFFVNTSSKYGSDTQTFSSQILIVSLSVSLSLADLSSSSILERGKQKWEFASTRGKAESTARRGVRVEVGEVEL
jgi:hypothetical protein